MCQDTPSPDLRIALERAPWPRVQAGQEPTDLGHRWSAQKGFGCRVNFSAKRNPRNVIHV